MKCKTCGSQVTRVLQSYDWQDAFTKRQRQCSAGHLFETFEVYGNAVNKSKIKHVLRGVADRRRAADRRRVVLASTASASVLARQLGITEAAVRYLRRK